MKKTVAFLLALSLSLVSMMTAALALEAADVLGVWYLQMPGSDYTVTLHEDGTATSASLGSEATGAWELEDDKLLLIDEEVRGSFTLVDGVLKGDISGFQASFGREPAPEAFAAAPVVAAADVSDFDGEWTGTQIGGDGKWIPLETMGASMTASISAGAIQLTTIDAGGGEQVTEVQGTLEDGAMTAVNKIGDQELPMLLELHEDGTLSITSHTGLQTFYEPAAAEADEAA